MKQEKLIDCSLGNGTTFEVVNVEEMKSVKEVCNLLGITRKTLFYYDKIGLLKPSSRQGSQKQKFYNENAIKTLCVIRILKSAGFGVKEIKDYLSVKGEVSNMYQMIQMKNRKEYDEIKHKIKLLETIRKIDLRNKSLEELLDINKGE